MPLPVQVPSQNIFKGFGGGANRPLMPGSLGYTLQNQPAAAAPVGTTPVGSAPSATAGYQGQNGERPDTWDWSQALSGKAGYDAAQTSQNYVYNPNAANYTIAGQPLYQGQQKDLASQYGGLGSQAFSQTNALNQQAAAQNAAYQNNVNTSTQNFLNNAQGLGNYDTNLANQGAQQQQQAYNAIMNVAQGNGPSLAGKNIQAALNQQNAAAHAQSLANQGLGGAGNAQRNLLSAQAQNANNAIQAGQQASVAEQLGAIGQQNAAATNLRAANQAQASAASSAGLAQRSLNAGALSNQYSAQLAGNNLANNTAINALGLGYGTQAAALGGQAAAYNNAFNANIAQQQANQAYDQALQAEGNTRAQINTNAVQSQAAQNQGIITTLGNVASGIGQGIAISDQSMKTDIDQSDKTTNALQSILGQLGNDLPGPASQVLNEKLEKEISDKHVSGPASGALNGISGGMPNSGGGGDNIGGSIGNAIGSAVGWIGSLFSDERLKTDIKSGDVAAREFMDKIKPSSFRYKDPTIPGTTEGTNLGVMAQDMQKSAIGKELVEKHPSGYLQYSIPKAVNLSLASLAYLNKRINKLERART